VADRRIPLAVAHHKLLVEGLAVVHVVDGFPSVLAAILLGCHKVHRNAQHYAYLGNVHAVAEVDCLSSEVLRRKALQVDHSLEVRGIADAEVEGARHLRMCPDAGYRHRGESMGVVGRLHKQVAGDALLRHTRSHGHHMAENEADSVGRTTAVCHVGERHAEEVGYKRCGPSRWVDKRLEVQLQSNRLAGYYAGNSQNYFPPVASYS
jgi:hypothetical protein